MMTTAMSYSTERAVKSIEERHARGQREFCLGVTADSPAIWNALRARGWTVFAVECSLANMEVIGVSR